MLASHCVIASIRSPRRCSSVRSPLMHFGHVLADQQLAEVLQMGRPSRNSTRSDQPVGVVHLFDGLVVFCVFRKLWPGPSSVHARMQKILIDGGQFMG